MNELSKKIIELTIEYIGPASEKFISRQVRQHLSSSLEDITIDDIDELANWVNISAGLIIEKNKAQELSEKIKSLKLQE